MTRRWLPLLLATSLLILAPATVSADKIGPRTQIGRAHV